MARDLDPLHTWLPVMIGRVVQTTSHTKIFDLLPTERHHLPDFEPGAHIAVQCGDLVRHYSLLGPQANPELYRIAVKREDPSRGGSRWLFEHARVGSQLSISAPRNNFPLVDAPNLVFLAGGIGITPILAMLSALREKGVCARLVYLCRSPDDFAFAEHIGSESAHHDVLIHFDSVAGGIYDVVAELRKHPPSTEVYCCGPMPLMKAVRDFADASGQAERYHFEFFSAEPVAASPAALEEFDLLTRKSGKTIHVGIGETVLAALRTAGFPLESECEEGVCGTCMVRVISGVPDHRDFVLTKQERAENTQMMTCVSRARTPTIVLDL